MNHYHDREQRIRKAGSEIYSAMAGEVPALFDTRRWMGRIMDWAMKDETFKSQLFRYIGVLPSLKTDADVVELLKEYFTEEVNTPPIIRRGIERLGKGAFRSYVIARTIKAGVESVAKQFIAGKDPEAALKALRSLRETGFALSVDLLGEVVVSEREAKEYRERYLSLLDFMGAEVSAWKEDLLLDRDDKGAIPRFDVSVKISSLYSRLDPMDWEGSMEQTKKSLRPLFRKARETGASLCFDMEHYSFKDLIIAIFQSILEEFPDYPFAGIALQAYLKENKGGFSWSSLNGRGEKRGG